MARKQQERDAELWIDRVLVAWVDAVRSRARTAVGITLLATLACGLYASRNLSFNVDPNALFSSDLRFQKAIVEFGRYFPVLTNSLLVVVDAPSHDAARRTAERLLPALEARRDVFTRAFLPGEDSFFATHGLLYASEDDLYDFADEMARLQPLLHGLAESPDLPTLAKWLRTGLEEGESEGFDDDEIETWRRLLGQMRDTARAAAAGDAAPLSWETLVAEATGVELPPRTVIVVDPILDMDRVLGAELPIAAVRETVAALGLEQGATRVRITGYPALNQEEMVGLAGDTALAGALSFLLVVAVLARAFGSARLVGAAAVTLGVSLVWAAAFSALTVRELNPISITFGVLVIGLGIDFMIHLGMHFTRELGTQAEREGDADVGAVGAALRRATRETGKALVLCAVTTGFGFLAFAPTDYRGVSDLGVAASGGMVIVLFHTLTLFPALIELWVRPDAGRKLARRKASPIARLRVSRPGVVCGVALALGAGAVALLPRVDLDTNVVAFRNPATESVQAFSDLLAAEQTTPWYLDALVPSLEQADDLARELRALPLVERAVTATDLVPTDQEAKREVLADVAWMLALPERIERRPADARARLEALRELRDFLAAPPLPADSPLAPALAELHEALEPYAGDGDAGAQRSARLAAALLDGLPERLTLLRESLEASAVGEGDVPPGLRSRMLAADGHARIQVYPAESLWDSAAMIEFVEAVRPIWGEISGLPVNLVESARATWQSLREALLWSGAAITLLLLALWRRPGDTLITLLPLLWAVLLTQSATVLLSLPFNFVNVIVLPLLLGIGVDSGIHLVHRARELGGDTSRLLRSTTANAVGMSALTTLASFGTLALSAHRGVSSLGLLLMLGMALTLVANLVVLPALLALRARGA